MGLGQAGEWLDAASEVTGMDIPRALERGSRALARTEVLQPALVAVALAGAEALEGVPDVVAGHSLGEFTAACWAASLTPREALRLVALRARAMASAAAACSGGMATVAGDEASVIAELEGAPGVLEVAAVNAPDETVVSGDDSALAWLAARRPITRLRVAGPWHSARMEPAVAPFKDALSRVFSGRTLRAPVVSAGRAGAVLAADLPSVLAEGLVHPVRWVETVQALSARGVDRALLPPPSRHTRALLRRAGARAWSL